MTAREKGSVYGIGVGPGDPELLTLKAVRIIEASPVIAYLASPQGHSQARDIAARWLTQQRQVPILVSCQTDRSQANRAYDQAAVTLGEALEQGQDVAILCEGDPLFYGSFTYLFQRLGAHYPCRVIPGISSVSAVAAVTGRPLATAAEAIGIVPGTAPEAVLRHALETWDTVAIMKPGRHRPKLLQLLRETGRIEDAVYVEQATRPNQHIVTRVDTLEATPGPYFALFLVTPRRIP